MIKIEAETLEEAYVKASKQLQCSIATLQSKVLQYPSKGLLGFLKKNAIIEVYPPKKKEKVEEIPVVEATAEESVAEEIIATLKKEETVKTSEVEATFEKDGIVDNFFEVNTEIEENDTVIVYDELAMVIENELKELLSHICFEIDVVEVDVRDNTALIFIDGEDAALLIGKEGYRYNALSYMLFNWLHTKYELFIKLEIAEFFTKQQEMIASYMEPVIETVEKTGRAKTHFLDGILVQIALEQLRERFPDKYVAVKTSRDGKKFVVINAFNAKTNG